MGSTKDLAAEKQEKIDAQAKETLDESRKIKLKGITIENYNALLAYLDNRPHKEVALLIQVLKESPVVDARIIDNPKG